MATRLLEVERPPSTILDLYRKAKLTTLRDLGHPNPSRSLFISHNQSNVAM